MPTITDLMTVDPEYLDPEARIEDAWKLMNSQGVRHVPVCKRGKLVGLVTQKDLLVSAQNTALLTLPVAEVMVFNVRSIDRDTSPIDAAKMMLKERISCLPITDEGHLAGIITETDLLKLLIQMLAE